MQNTLSKQALIRRAIIWDLLTEEEAARQQTKDAAEEVAWEINSIYDGGDHGFGSSDMAGAVKEFLQGAGFKVDWPANGGPLQRMDK